MNFASSQRAFMTSKTKLSTAMEGTSFHGNKKIWAPMHSTVNDDNELQKISSKETPIDIQNISKADMIGSGKMSQSEQSPMERPSFSTTKSASVQRASNTATDDMEDVERGNADMPAFENDSDEDDHDNTVEEKSEDNESAPPPAKKSKSELSGKGKGQAKKATTPRKMKAKTFEHGIRLVGPSN